MGKQTLRRRFVSRKIPEPPKAEIAGVEAAFWPARRVESPQLRGDVRRVAHRHRPGAWRVHDQGPLARISHLLSAALSQANTLGGNEGTIFWNHVRTSLTASDLTVTLPSSSTSCAP